MSPVVPYFSVPFGWVYFDLDWDIEVGGVLCE